MQTIWTSGTVYTRYLQKCHSYKLNSKVVSTIIFSSIRPNLSTHCEIFLATRSLSIGQRGLPGYVDDRLHYLWRIQGGRVSMGSQTRTQILTISISAIYGKICRLFCGSKGRCMTCLAWWIKLRHAVKEKNRSVCIPPELLGRDDLGQTWRETGFAPLKYKVRVNFGLLRSTWSFCTTNVAPGSFLHLVLRRDQSS